MMIGKHGKWWRVAAVSGVTLALLTVAVGCAKRPSSGSSQAKTETGFYIYNAEAPEGNGNTLDFRVELVGTYSHAVSVYAVADGRCNDPAVTTITCADFVGFDAAHPSAGIFEKVPFQSPQGTLTFQPGEKEKTLHIKLAHNGYYEKDKILIVDLRSTGEIDTPNPVTGWGRAYGVIHNIDAAPHVSIAWVPDGLCNASTCSVEEASQWTKQINVTMNGYSQLPVDVPLSTGGSSKRWADYILFAGDVAGIAHAAKLADLKVTVLPYNTQASAVVEVIDDGDDEATETLEIGVNEALLSAANSGGQDAKIASNTAKKITVDIVDNDTQKFSRVRKVAPMGVNKCIEDIVDGSGKTVVRRNSAGCVANGIGFLGQDALDRTPISYTAYKNDGTEVPTSDLLKYTVVETVVDTVVVKKTVPVDISVWANKRNAVACIKDNNTGLTWEAKNYLTAQNTRTPSLHAYNLRFLGLGQDSKSVASCEGSGTITATACLAEFFVAEVNHEKLCGMTGWRLPRIEELRSLALYDPVPAENSKLYYHDQNYFWWLSAGVALAVDIFDYTSADSVSGISLGMPFYPSVGGNGINQKILDSNAYSLMLVHD